MTSRALRMINRIIPATSACRPGCGDCCGPVPWSAEEFARVKADLPPGSHRVSIGGIQTVENPATRKCAFLGPAGCTVYDRRPYMCRLFGAAAVPALTCPHGVRAKRPLSPDQAHALTARYDREPPLAPHAPQPRSDAP